MTEDSIQKSLVTGRILVASLCSVVAILAGFKGYYITEAEQAAIVDSIMALLSAVAGVVAIASKLRSIKKIGE